MSAQLLSRAVVGLQSGKLPDDVAEWLLGGLLAYRDRGEPLDLALGLRARPGKANEHPPRAYLLEKRDGLLRALAYWQGEGSPAERAAVICGWLDDLDEGFAPDEGVTIRYLLAELSVFKVPRSHRQVLRILEGYRSR